MSSSHRLWLVLFFFLFIFILLIVGILDEIAMSCSYLSILRLRLQIRILLLLYNHLIVPCRWHSVAFDIIDIHLSILKQYLIMFLLFSLLLLHIWDIDTLTILLNNLLTIHIFRIRSWLIATILTSIGKPWRLLQLLSQLFLLLLLLLYFKPIFRLTLVLILLLLSLT